MARIKKGDLVQVISGGSKERGGDKGKQGLVLAVHKETGRVIVEGVNIVKKHQKVGQSERGAKTGGIITAEAPIHESNVALVDPATKKPAKVGFKIEVDEKTGASKKVRVIRKTGKAI